MDGYGFIILSPVAVELAWMKTYPPAYSRKRTFFKDRQKGFAVQSFIGEVEELRDINPCGAGFLTGSCHENRFRFLKAPFSGLSDFRTAV
jgi:hypothetical protein